MRLKYCILAFSIFATQAPAFAQSKVDEYMAEKLDQRERSLAKAGGDSARAAAKQDGAWGVGMVSSNCMESVKAGKQSPYYCLGVEAISKDLVQTMPDLPDGKKDKQLKDWFSAEKQKNRVLAYCIMFLRTTEQKCGDHYAAAKMAVQ